MSFGKQKLKKMSRRQGIHENLWEGEISRRDTYICKGQLSLIWKYCSLFLFFFFAPPTPNISHFDLRHKPSWKITFHLSQKLISWCNASQKKKHWAFLPSCYQKRKKIQSTSWNELKIFCFQCVPETKTLIFLY